MSKDSKGFENGTHEKGRLWLYENKYAKTDRHPFLTGPGEISKVALRRIVDEAKGTNEDTVKLRCAAWKRTSKNGNDYTYVTFEPETPKPSQEEAEEEVPF
jgi:hypothetical protein